MNKYVDAEKLIAEIIKLKARKGFLPLENTEITEAYMARGVQFTCDDIVNLIKKLQHEEPEVDLEKEMNKLISLEYVNQPDDEWEMCIARHFYSLWLNARKEE